MIDIIMQIRSGSARLFYVRQVNDGSSKKEKEEIVLASEAL